MENNNDNNELDQVRPQEDEMDDNEEAAMPVRFIAVLNNLLNEGNDQVDEEIENDELEVDVPENERVQFDTEATTSHQYLHADDETRFQPGQCWIEGTETVKLPTIRQNAVVFPGQKLPILTVYPSDRQAVNMAVKNKSYLAFRTCFGSHRHGWYADQEEKLDDLHGSVGTLLLLSSITDDGTQVRAIMTGMQRCRFLSFERGMAGILISTVEVVQENIKPALINTICPNSSLRLGANKKRRLSEAIGSIPSVASFSVSLTKNCEELADWMRLWNTEDHVRHSLEEGPERFSFWVAMNIPAHLRDKYQFLQEDCTDFRVLSLLKAVEALTELVCSRCDLEISKVDKILKMAIDNASGLFVNNYGVIHEMLTLSEATNFLYEGRPTAEYSWFPGYKWHILKCMCGNHLGWEFSSPRFLPAKFYGLTREGISPRPKKEVAQLDDANFTDLVLHLIQNTPNIEDEL